MNSHSARNVASSASPLKLPQYRRLAERRRRRFQRPLHEPPPRRPPPAARRRTIEPGNVAPTPRTVDGVDYIEGRDLTLIYEGRKCIHSRFCVTWGPKVFIANVKGPWINPDNMPTEALAEIAHVCVSGAIRYKRKDGKPDEAPPPVNLVSVRENGPYADPRRHPARRRAGGELPPHAVPLRRLEAQAVLRRLAQRGEVRRERRATHRQGGDVAGA